MIVHELERCTTLVQDVRRMYCTYYKGDANGSCESILLGKSRSHTNGSFSDRERIRARALSSAVRIVSKAGNIITEEKLRRTARKLHVSSCEFNSCVWFEREKILMSMLMEGRNIILDIFHCSDAGMWDEN